MSRIVLDHYTLRIGTRSILSNICLEVRGGEWVSIRGASGAGKSTLLAAIAGAGRHETSGSLNVEKDTQSRFASAIGWVPQEVSLWSHMTLFKNVAFTARQVARRNVGESAQVAASLLAQLGLEAHSGQYPATLSGGQARRGALARALAANPSFLLLDETCGSLDSTSRDLVLASLDRARDDGTGIVLVAHDFREIGNGRDIRHCCLSDGVLSEDRV
jgi:ABC-type sulfate/molybdate transport systems ATPase subunit